MIRRRRIMGDDKNKHEQTESGQKDRFEEEIK